MGNTRSSSRAPARGKWVPKRRETLRIAKLWNRLPDPILKHQADLWERLLCDVPEFKVHKTELDDARLSYGNKAHHIEALIPLLSVLEIEELAVLRRAMVESFISGPWSKDDPIGGRGLPVAIVDKRDLPDDDGDDGPEDEVPDWTPPGVTAGW